MAISSRTDLAALAMLGLLCSPMVLAETPPAPRSSSVEEAPLYSAEDAWRLAHAPESWMVDSETCERIEGFWRNDAQGNRQVVANGDVALFREDSQRHPFARLKTRSDGVFVARFSAKPNEVIYARSYRIDPRTRRYVYGEPTQSVCRRWKVSTGELEPVVEEKPDADTFGEH